jgi:hypothetical protein
MLKEENEEEIAPAGIGCFQVTYSLYLINYNPYLGPNNFK